MKGLSLFWIFAGYQLHGQRAASMTSTASPIICAPLTVWFRNSSSQTWIYARTLLPCTRLGFWLLQPREYDEKDAVSLSVKMLYPSDCSPGTLALEEERHHGHSVAVPRQPPVLNCAIWALQFTVISLVLVPWFSAVCSSCCCCCWAVCRFP